MIDADSLAKELSNTSAAIRKQLLSELGPDAYLPEGTLNRDHLRTLIFEDPQTRQRINAIIHPHVMDEVGRRFEIEARAGTRLVGVEAALIYEANMDHMLGAVVVVSAPLEHRVHWLGKRDGLPREEIIKRLRAQMPLEEKVARADYVVENDSSLEALETRVDDLHSWLLARAGGQGNKRGQ